MNATDPNNPSRPQNPAVTTADPRATLPNAGANATLPTSPELAHPELHPKASLLADWVGGVLGHVARFLDAAFVEQSLTLARTVGHYAVVGGAALTLLYSIYAGIKQNSFGLFLGGVALIVGIAVAQFAAQRFLRAADAAVANTHSTLASMAFVECIGLLSVLLAVVTLVAGVVSAVQLSSTLPLLPAIVMAALLTYFGAIALHPELVNIGIVPTTPGEEAIGLLSFFLKSGLKLVPVLFCLVALGGCLALIGSFFESGESLVNRVGAVLEFAPGAGRIASGAPGLTAATVVLFAALLPLGAYFLFVMQYLLLDLWRAILSVPGKLDLLHRP